MIRLHHKQHLELRISEYSGIPAHKLKRIPALALEFAYVPPRSTLKGYTVKEFDFRSCPTANLAPTDQMSEVDARGLRYHLKKCLMDKDYRYMQVLHITLALEQRNANERREKLLRKLGEKRAKLLAEEVMGKDKIRAIQKYGYIRVRTLDGRVCYLTLKGIFDKKWEHICTEVHGINDLGSDGIKYDELLANYVTLFFNFREITEQYSNIRAPFWELDPDSSKKDDLEMDELVSQVMTRRYT